MSLTYKQIEAMNKAKTYRETGAYSKLEETAIYLLEIIEAYEREMKDLRRRLRNLRGTPLCEGPSEEELRKLAFNRLQPGEE